MSAVSVSAPVTRMHSMPYGAEWINNAQVRFRFWAPSQPKVRLLLDEECEIPMDSLGDGWYELISGAARPGSRYRFLLPDGSRVPDPASRFQPKDVHGPSEVIDPAAYQWGDEHWNGRPWQEAVIYELHVGAFTEEGTFRAAADKIGHLVSLGVTAIEMMPVGDFPGRCNWGYDGVLPYAPDSSYGRPEDLKSFIDQAHACGLMVFLDVVYNHFGPDGNYLPLYAPQFFTERHQTPWGAAINYDGLNSGPVREFIIHNALYWIEEFHLDGLRLDAVHAIIDDSPKHVLQELAERVRALGGNRHIHLIVENEENQAGLLEAKEGGGLQYNGQWNDDLHHVLHTAATGEQAGYYGDYIGDTEKLGKALAEGFAFQGEVMRHRGSSRGEASRHLRPDAFVSFIQNHDQVGNRAFGDRISSVASAEAVRAIAAVYLLLPQTPMMFMGEEWNSLQPFPFFCDFEGELAALVAKGRREEFAKFPEFQDPETRDEIPDAQAEKTFQSAKLLWSNITDGPSADSLKRYQSLLRVRRQSVLPIIAAILPHAGEFDVIGDKAVVVRWKLSTGKELTLYANLSGSLVCGFPLAMGMQIWSEGGNHLNTSLGPWSVRWFINSR